MSAAVLRSPWLTLPIFFGLFFGGGWAGIQVSRALAPGSGVAEFVSFLALPAAFVVGLAGWAGAAIPAAVGRLIRLARERPRERDGSTPPKPEESRARIPPGSFAFVPAGLATCTISGMVVAGLSGSLGFGWVLGLYAALGLAYGVACWRLARTGYLPFPRE